jgi:hypothetical protein
MTSYDPMSVVEWNMRIGHGRACAEFAHMTSYDPMSVVEWNMRIGHFELCFSFRYRFYLSAGSNDSY